MTIQLETKIKTASKAVTEKEELKLFEAALDKIENGNYATHGFFFKLFAMTEPSVEQRTTGPFSREFTLIVAKHLRDAVAEYKQFLDSKIDALQEKKK